MIRRRGIRFAGIAVCVAAPLGGPPAFGQVPLPPIRPLELRVDAVPLPPLRPPRPGETPAAETPQEEAQPGAAAPPATPPEPSACQRRLAEIAAILPLPALAGPGECGAADVVRLDGLVLRDWNRVVLNPPATLRCNMAEAVVQWVREDVAAAADALGARLAAIENYDSYACRGRNRVAGAKVSEHGKGNAIDIRAFRLADGRRLEWTDPAIPKPPRERLKASACARFTTVLGPGSDGYHEGHIHVDLAERRGNHRMCQWNVLDLADLVPLPRPRPAEAPARAPEPQAGAETEAAEPDAE